MKDTQLHNPEQFTMTDLISQVGTWADRNFPDVHVPDLGIIEEIGEAVHGIIKRHQKIRGMTDDAKFQAHMEDAFADAGIYVIHAAYTFKCLLPINSVDSANFYDHSDRRIVAQLFHNLTPLLIQADRLEENLSVDYDEVAHVLGCIWNWLQEWAYKYSIDLRTAVKKTWLKVRERDWIAHPENAYDPLS